jgi:hypothetical protein
MFARHRSLTIIVCIVILSTLVAGCARQTHEVREVFSTVVSTVVVTATPVEEPATIMPTLELVPTPTPPPAPTSEPPAVLPTSPTLPPTLTPMPPPDPLYDDRGTPVRLLASHYNAVNCGEYRRAWDYWENPPNPSYEDFVLGYADTVHVFLAVSPPTFIKGAAGSRYASVPTLLVATHTDGSQHTFVGCYVTRRVASGVEGGSIDEEWMLHSATVSAAPGNAADGGLLGQACDLDQSEPLYENRQDPVLLLASYFDAINRQEYRRAWEYWENPPNPSYEDFAEGYAETESVLLVVHPPVQEERAAGSVYAGVPTLLVATHHDGSQRNFAGCYVARRVNPDIPGAVDKGWSLYTAAVNAIPGNSADVTVLAWSCGTE